MYEFYGFIRKQTRDSASKEGGELEFPAGYMFKDVPQLGGRGHRRPGPVPPRRARPAQHQAGDRHALRRSGAAGAARVSRPVLRGHQRRPERRHGGAAQDRPGGRGVRPQVRRTRSPPACTRRSRSTTRSSIRSTRSALSSTCRSARPRACPGRASRTRRRTSRTSTRCAGSSPSSSSSPVTAANRGPTSR